MSGQTTRREFIIMVSAAAGGMLLAACRPASASDPSIPTLVPEGFHPGALSPTPSSLTNTPLPTIDFSESDPEHSQITFDSQIRITPIDKFYVQLWNFLPAPVAIDSWSFEIHGLVDHPTTVTYPDLLALEPVTVMRTLECIGNPVGGSLIGNTTWTGTRLKPILDQVGVQSKAVRAKFAASDRYMTSVDLDWLLQDDTLLVYEMDGRLLTHEHGYPLRIMIPGLYGQKMPKWLFGMEFIRDKFQGYYEHYGWSDKCEVKTNSQIVLPENSAAVTGTFALQGWAYGGKRKITKVEISIDDGDWKSCDLLYGDSPLVWTQWWTKWTPEHEGTFKVEVRATDDTGFMQNQLGEPGDSAYPDGTNAIHSFAYQAQSEDS